LGSKSLTKIIKKRKKEREKEKKEGKRLIAF